MKIKKHNWTTFQIIGDKVTILTDPLELKNSGLSFQKTKADVVLFSNPEDMLKENILTNTGLNDKIAPDRREGIIEITSCGEFEIGGFMIRRDIGTNFYIIDEQNLRVVYLGLADNDFNVDLTEDLGDVDVLIAPIGNGSMFIDYDKLQKIFSNIDPAILIPCGYAQSGLKVGENIKTREDFIKYFGFTSVSDETTLTVKPRKDEAEETPMEVIFL